MMQHCKPPTRLASVLGLGLVGYWVCIILGIMENQMEKKMENEMETGIIGIMENQIRI